MHGREEIGPSMDLIQNRLIKLHATLFLLFTKFNKIDYLFLEIAYYNQED